MDYENFSLDGFQLIGIYPHHWLKERRIALNITQAQVAEKAKIPLQSYQRFESGARNIMSASFQMACRIIEALDMDITGFYHYKYVLSPPIYQSPEGLRYQHNDKLVDEDVTEDADATE